MTETYRTEVQTGVYIGGTHVGGSGHAGIGVVSEEEVGWTDMTEVQTGVEISWTEVGGGGTAGRGVVYMEEVGWTDVIVLIGLGVDVTEVGGTGLLG